MNQPAAEIIDEVTAPVETNDVEPATPETSPEADEASPATDTSAPQKTGAEKRIGQLTRKYRQAERENEALRERFDALEKRVGPEPSPERPNADDFETASDYEDSLFQWRDDVKAHKEAVKPKDPQKVKPEGWDDFTDQVESLKTTYPDIEKLVFTDDYAFTEDMMTVVMDSERGAEIAYHLATNKSEASRIANLSPTGQAREIFKIEQSFSAQPTSNAPDPAGNIRPGGQADIDPDNMTADQWRAQREAEIRRRDGLE